MALYTVKASTSLSTQIEKNGDIGYKLVVDTQHNIVCKLLEEEEDEEEVEEEEELDRCMHKREINMASPMWPLFTVSEEVNSSLQCIFCQGREPIYFYLCGKQTKDCASLKICVKLYSNIIQLKWCVSLALELHKLPSHGHNSQLYITYKHMQIAVVDITMRLKSYKSCYRILISSLLLVFFHSDKNPVIDCIDSIMQTNTCSL